jgi:hypothetical protein
MPEENRKNQMIVLIEAIALFLSGSFLIETIRPHLFLSQNTRLDNILNWLIMIIGYLIVVFGFYAVFTSIISELSKIVPRLFKNANKIRICYVILTKADETYSRSRSWFLSLLFSITMTQILPVILNYKIKELSIIAWIFITFITLAIVIGAWETLMKKAFLLVQLAFVLVIMAIIQNLQNTNKTVLTTNLGLVAIFLFLAFISIRNSESRKLKLFR